MENSTSDAFTARRQLAARGWIPRSADAFRHLPPPGAALWLGEDAPAADWLGAAALEDGWILQALPGTSPGAFEARWLDAADAVERAELFHGLGAAATEHDDAAPFAWVHRALVRRGLRVRIAAGATAMLRLQRRACRAVEAPFLVLDLLAGARCVLLESHEREDASALVQNLHVQVRVAEGASLRHLRHVAPADADRVAHHVHARLARDARYDQALLASGSDYHLQRIVLDLEGEDAEARAGGVLLAGAAAALEQQVRARHAAPRTRSSAEVLALASGASRVVANAHTHIAPGCDDAETRQRLAGIPVGGQPRLVLRPHLEIHHDQVQAAHGATWGALPEEALFFARQRGLDERAAKALILQGLARAALARVIDQDALPQQLSLEAALAATVARHLEAQGDTTHG